MSRLVSRSLSAPGPSGAREYTLYEWYVPRRPLPVRKRPAWPPPMFKQGPYWVEPSNQGELAHLRCTPRRGTRAFKRMQAQQALQQQRHREVGFLLVFVLVFMLFLVFAH